MRVFCSHPRRLQQIAIRCKRSDYNNFLRNKNVKNSTRLFSAIVPDSSFARVRKVLVPHMEEEGEEQENEKEDEREDGKQRVEGRRESSNTHHERMDGMK